VTRLRAIGAAAPFAIGDAREVGGGLVGVDVAGDGGDGFDRRLGRCESEDERERIVDAGIGVDDEVHI
jgi:hypothetical protein